MSTSPCPVYCNFRAPPDLIDGARRLAEAKKITLSAVFRAALRDHLAATERQDRTA